MITIHSQVRKASWLGGLSHLRWMLRAFAALLAVGLGLAPLGVAGAPRIAMTVNGVDASRFPQVVSYLTIVNENGFPVLGLGAVNFDVTEDGVPVKEVGVTPMVNSQERLAAVVVVDVSGSMDQKAMQDAKRAAATFVNGLGPRDEASIMAFSTQVWNAQGFTTDKGALLGAVDSLQAKGNTALYDALFAAVDYAAESAITRKIVVLETDGNDTSSKAALDDGINLARQKGVRVYVIGLGNEIDRKVLSRIATSTGGNALFAPNSSDLEQAYGTITDQLRNQYVLSYLSPSPKGAKSYKLGIKVTELTGNASAETTFDVKIAPPAVTMSLRDGAVLNETATFSVDVESARPVAEVRLEVNSRPLTRLSAPPYSFTLEPTDLSTGRQQVVVIVTDSAGSTATKRVSVVVPAGGKPEESAPAPQPEASGWAFPNLTAFFPTDKMEGIAQAIQGAKQNMADGVQGAKQSMVDGVQGAFRPIQSFFTEGIPMFFQSIYRTLLLVVVMLAASGLAGLESWKLYLKARARLQRLACPDCQTEYRAYEERCPRCWMEEALAQQETRGLGEILIENRLLSREDVEASMALSAEMRRPLDAVLLDQGLVSAEQMSQALFYLSHSAEMAERRRELFDTKDEKRPWEAKLFAPRLTVLLVAAVTWGVSFSQVWQ